MRLRIKKGYKIIFVVLSLFVLFFIDLYFNSARIMKEARFYCAEYAKLNPLTTQSRCEESFYHKEEFAEDVKETVNRAK